MVRKQDDFYEAVNGAWEKTAVIPNDKPRTGGFSDLSDEIEKWLLTVTADWQAGKNLPDSPILSQFIAYHRLATDFATREQQGTQPVQALLQQYQSYTSFADFAQHIAELEKQGLPNALPLGVGPDFKDARTNVLWASAINLVLPDTIINKDKRC